VRERVIEKQSIKQDEIDIVDFLVRQFVRTPQFQQGDTLLPETDSYVDSVRKRVPDLAYFTADQRKAIRRDEHVNTLFAIEILSESESHEHVLEKIQDYFDGGAVLVWYLVPKRQRIYAYTSPEKLKVFKGTDRITAAPLLPDFAFGVAEVFG
jgi:Uma2 family endonuclease